jgi:hypothetical protein
MKRSILIVIFLVCAFKTKSQTLQSVTENGNTTTKNIVLNTGSEALSLIGPSYLSFKNAGNTARTGYVQHNGSNLVINSDVGNTMFNNKVGIISPFVYGESVLHIKSFNSSPWTVLTEANANQRVIGMSHIGTAGVIAVSYLDNSGYSPLQLWTSNIPRVTITPNGDMGVGTEDPKGYKLAVNGKIRAHEIKVETANWPDYVFAKDYALPSLKETEKHIQEKGHLPGIPSAAEVKSSGVDLGEMNAKLLKKIEELTLYLIEKEKKDTAQQEQINLLKSQMEKILGSESKLK